MTQDWLLVETLGEEPVVVAQGRQMKNFVPIGTFLRRNQNLAAIQTAIAETVSGGNGLASITPTTKRVIRTEPVLMTDGRIHGVHLWCGQTDVEPEERPIPGAYTANITLGEVAVTPQFLINIGKDPADEPLVGRSLAEDIPVRSFNEGEAKALSWIVDQPVGRTLAANWGWADPSGMFRRVGFCVRGMTETVDGTEQLMARAMNLLEAVGDAPSPNGQLPHRIVEGMAQPGVYRAIVDLTSWTLLKWLDDPCPYYNWRGKVQMHPDDYPKVAGRMTEELKAGATSAVVRLPGNGGGWTPLHVTVNRVELDDGVFAGLVNLRLPTDAELAESAFAISDQVSG